MSTPMQVPEPATSRIIRLTNVHFKATNDEIKALFQDFEIESLFRTVNVRTGKKSVAYVLFSTITEKNQACAMSGLWIRDREISVQPASTSSNYELNDDGTAFVNSKKTTTATAQPEDKSPSINDANFPALGTLRSPQGQKSLEERARTSKAITPTENTKTGTETVESYVERAECAPSQSLPAVDTKVATPASETNTTLAVEGDNNSSRHSSPKEKPYPPFKAGDHIPPPPTTLDNFNLAGNDANDPAESFPTATGWYNFQADQFAKVEQAHREKGTNASRIANSRIQDGDGIDGDDDDDDVVFCL